MQIALVITFIFVPIAYIIGNWKGEKEGFRHGFVYGWQALKHQKTEYASDDVVKHMVAKSANKWEGEVWEWLRDSGVFDVIISRDNKYEVRRKI
jgi:hypothetical protein